MSGCSGPQFRCIARANLRVQEVDETVRSHDLTLAGDEAKSDLPLFGQICCRLAAQPNVHLSESVAGPVSLLVGTGGGGEVRWARGGGGGGCWLLAAPFPVRECLQGIRDSPGESMRLAPCGEEQRGFL